jgi:hypothetical protein
MTSPVTIGVTSIVVAPINSKRASIRFQNTGSAIIYIKKIPLTGSFSVVSPTDYEVELFPASSSQEGGEAFETNSVASFMAIGSSTSSLAIYETNNV